MLTGGCGGGCWKVDAEVAEDCGCCDGAGAGGGGVGEMIGVTLRP